MVLGEKLANVYPQGRLVGILKQANFVLFMRLLLITPLVGILAIVLSHRIAGPIFRIKKTLDEIIKGDYSKRLHLRNTDELQDVAESINNLMELLEKKKNKV
jgi:signal transduction histidine kinase